MSAFYESIVTIASSFCNNVFMSPKTSRYIGVGALHSVVVWDMLEQVEVAVLPGKTEMAFVTRIAASPNGRELAVGYENGVIAIYDLYKKRAVCEFAAQKCAVTCMQYDGEGDFLVSGSKDTEVVVWDVVANTCKARFNGHRGAITNVLFTNGSNCVISTSKDTFVKFWDVATNQCLKTLGGDPNDQVSSAVLCRDSRYLVTGNEYKEIKVYELKWTAADAANTEVVLQCHLIYSDTLVARGRLIGLSTYHDVLACYTDRGLLSLYSLRIRTDDSCPVSESKEIKAQRKKLAKLIKRGKLAADYTAEAPTERQSSTTASVDHLTSLKMDAKVVSTSLLQFADGKELRAAVTLANNSVQLVSFDFSEDYNSDCTSNARPDRVTPPRPPSPPSPRCLCPLQRGCMDNSKKPSVRLRQTIHKQREMAGDCEKSCIGHQHKYGRLKRDHDRSAKSETTKKNIQGEKFVAVKTTSTVAYISFPVSKTQAVKTTAIQPMSRPKD
ncbi:unnamed protein product [Spodoptera littoralis]|uniref:Uncharacterized protein n=1 Tax=Spodoptera littoralis TaxID=7109 RepID=A0A9P0I902_SPOLI|nr:unnamed protein product [Spodoptera littoralis]CAH1642252.1 unnamed protein product [Spodoptera littoralis]